MRKRDRATYLVLLEVGAIEDHMAPAALRRARGMHERGPARALQSPTRTRHQGGFTR